jgi:hypothetical protein
VWKLKHCRLLAAREMIVWLSAHIVLPGASTPVQRADPGQPQQAGHATLRLHLSALVAEFSCVCKAANSGLRCCVLCCVGG